MGCESRCEELGPDQGAGWEVGCAQRREGAARTEDSGTALTACHGLPPQLQRANDVSGFNELEAASSLKCCFLW